MERVKAAHRPIVGPTNKRILNTLEHRKHEVLVAEWEIECLGRRKAYRDSGLGRNHPVKTVDDIEKHGHYDLSTTLNLDLDQKIQKVNEHFEDRHDSDCFLFDSIVKIPGF